MSFFTQFAGSPSTVSINNAFSSGTPAAVSLTSADLYGKNYLSGSLTANTLSTVLNVTSPGVVFWVAAYTEDATARTMRIKITLDGTSVFDSTTASITAQFRGMSPIGDYRYTGGGDFPVYQPIIFNSSMKIEVASNLSETDKFKIFVVYTTTA